MKKQSTTCYLERRQLRELRELSVKLRVPVAELVRQGIDKILEREKEVLDGTRR